MAYVDINVRPSFLKALVYIDNLLYKFKFLIVFIAIKYIIRSNRVLYAANTSDFEVSPSHHKLVLYK